MNWRSCFGKKVLERARAYWKNGSVRDLEVYDGKITASVDGTEEYDVEIIPKIELLSSWSCTCPYAADGNLCKHMAAVLFAWENGEAVQIKQRPVTIRDLVNDADEKTVREYLLQALEKDKRLAERFRIAVGSVMKEDIGRQKKTIDRLFRVHTIRERYGSYIDNIDDLFEDIETFITDVLRPILGANRYDDAFELSVYLFDSIAAVEYSDDDDPVELEEEIGAVWQQIIDESAGSRPGIFRWLLKTLEEDRSNSGICSQVLKSNIHISEYYPELLQWSEKRVEEASHSVYFSTTYNSLETRLQEHLDLMTEAALTREQIEAFSRQYWDHPAVRRFMTELTYKNGEYDKTILILKESIEIDKESVGIVVQHHARLKDLYHELHREDDYRNELRNIVLNVLPCDPEYFSELKSLYSAEEWSKERDELFSRLSEYPGYAELLYKEGLIDLLSDWLMGPGRSLRGMQQYEDILAKTHPEFVLKKYRESLSEFNGTAATRNEYKNMVERLKHMRTIPGGEEVVRDIVEDWRFRYRRRSALMEELEQSGL